MLHVIYEKPVIYCIPLAIIVKKNHNWSKKEIFALLAIRETFRPTAVYPLDFFGSGIQLYVLLSPYLCFIYFFYLNLYVLGEYAWIS